MNAGGDNMTGDLTINDKKVLTTGDYGHRDDDSGINADMLDGEHGSYYQDASNINKGKLDPARLSGTYNIDISGNAATASKLATARTISLAGNATGSAIFDGSGNVTINTTVSQAANADKLDGKHYSDLQNEFVNVAGDIMTGMLTVSTSMSAQYDFLNSPISIRERGLVAGSTNDQRYAPNLNFHWGGKIARSLVMKSDGELYYGAYDGSGNPPSNKVWHSGNDGSGSGLDADLLDGKHWSDIKSYIDANAGSIVAQSLGTNGYVKFNTGLMIQWGTGSVYGSNRPQTKNFPFPFPNAAFVIRVGTNGSGWSATVQGNVVSRTRYSVAYWNHGASSISYSFIAIGY